MIALILAATVTCSGHAFFMHLTVSPEKASARTLAPLTLHELWCGVDVYYGITGPSDKVTTGDMYWPACVPVRFVTGKKGTLDTVGAIRPGQTVGSCWIRECAGNDCRRLGREEIPSPCGGREYPPRSERR